MLEDMASRAPVLTATSISKSFGPARIVHDYPSDRPAGAALHLFASVALMFWYVLQLLLSLTNRD